LTFDNDSGNQSAIAIYRVRPELNLFVEHQFAHGLLGPLAERLAFLRRIDEGESNLEFLNLQFRFAKTMAETPHAYTTRSPANEVEYVELFGQRTGEATGIRYYYRGGWKYRGMTSDVRQSHVINGGQRRCTGVIEGS
jgi:hypothetical protein